jgi:hypothetical protein
MNHNESAPDDPSTHPDASFPAKPATPRTPHRHRSPPAPLREALKGCDKTTPEWKASGKDCFVGRGWQGGNLSHYRKRPT